MLPVGAIAPPFEIPTQAGTPFRLTDHLGQHNVLLLFLPAAFTPICTTELPALAAMREKFWKDAKTVVAAITTDNHPSNREWARRCNASQTYVLSDYRPQGAVAQAYGAWLPADGLADRATVIIGKDGRVRYSESVGKFGKRSIPALFDLARAIDGRAPLKHDPVKMPLDLPVLFLTQSCPYCKATLDALQSLHLEDRIVLRSVDTDAMAMRQLLTVNPQGSIPTLYFRGKIYVGAPQIGVALKNLAKKAA